jgi:NhaC family Na+:H+ antiporter
MTGVLGVPTIEYLPYAFFNIVNPLIALLFGFLGIGVERLPITTAGDGIPTDAEPARVARGRPTLE